MEIADSTTWKEKNIIKKILTDLPYLGNGHCPLVLLS
jgi:hypothetical protein